MIDKILNPNTKVGDIFPNDVTQAKNIYRDLCKKYHPDTFADDRANDIISALTKLYNNAIKAIETGTWEKSNFIAIKTTKGTTLNINYLYHRVFELGEYYVCNQHIIYIFDFNKKKYYNNYIKQINKISYKDKKMEKYFKNLFPQVISEYNTLDNKHIIVISKTEDVYPLRAVIENVFNGEIPDKHLAWMISRLINICCFLKMNGLVHNGINIDNCFVSTDFHSILLLGGWWYTTDEDAAMIGTSKDIYNIMPPLVKANKISKSITDIESIKAFGRQYISTSAPQAFKNFLSSGTKESSIEESKKYDTDVYCIGGESVYRQLLPYCDEAFITKIDHAYEADSFFPNLDEMPEWEMTETSDEQTYFDLEYTFTKYERKH